MQDCCILLSRWGENCQLLFMFLMLLSVTCLVGCMVYLYLGIVKYASDTRWLLLSALGALTSIAISVFLCWGVINILRESGLLGVYQCYACLDSTGQTERCDSQSSCDPNSWRLIYSEPDCSAAINAGIRCELTNLCMHSAPQTFWYSVGVAGLYVVVLVMTAMMIFNKMIPSLVLQSIDRSHLI